MRLPRLASIATIVVVILLSACSSGSSSKASTSSTTTSTSVATTTTTATSTTATTSTTKPAPTTVPPPTVPVSALGVPRIVTLTGPPTPVQCNAPTSVQLHWETVGAADVSLSIDTGPVFATYNGGRNTKLVPLACDGKAHTYTFIARSVDGQTALRAITITEHKI